jgi:hypothetical protein
MINAVITTMAVYKFLYIAAKSKNYSGGGRKRAPAGAGQAGTATPGGVT